MVATASMELPLLTHATDADFLRRISAKAIGIFMQRYTDQLGSPARKEWLELADMHDLDGLTQWIQTYADFESDAEASQRAMHALRFASDEVQRSIVSDYKEHRAHLPKQQS